MAAYSTNRMTVSFCVYRCCVIYWMQLWFFLWKIPPTQTQFQYRPSIPFDFHGANDCWNLHVANFAIVRCERGVICSDCHWQAAHRTVFGITQVHSALITPHIKDLETKLVWILATKAANERSHISSVGRWLDRSPSHSLTLSPSLSVFRSMGASLNRHILVLSVRVFAYYIVWLQCVLDVSRQFIFI